MASFTLKLSAAALKGIQLLIGKLLAVTVDQMQSGRFLFYDVAIWYLRSDTTSAPTLEIPSGIDLPSPMPEVDTQNASPDMETRSPTREVVPIRHPKNLHHPVGISISIVGQRGVWGTN
ncbi:MAG: hypothetical protein BYD32DRAFT_438898 [Podila humilis]|nr:MAG: hypothetical protein BYD32DRAFT_438898 [Podila humilis]